MPRGNNRKHTSKRNQTGAPIKELNLADDNQVYGVALRALGDRHFEVECQDKCKRRCKVRGAMRNRRYVRVGDVVLISLRDFKEMEADIVDVYTSEQVRAMRKDGILLVEGKQLETEIDDEKVDAEDTFDFDSI